jgi:hypothetical protein
MEQTESLPLPTPDESPPPPKKRRSVSRFLGYFLITALMLALLGSVLYLLSDINHRQYRLTTRQSSLVIERGRFMPMGFERFTPKNQVLRPIYAPIALPTGINFTSSETFDDRTDVDRAIFGVLSGWSREMLETGAAAEFEQVVTYIDRCELLPGLSEGQRLELQTLRADVAFTKGTHTLSGIAEQLDRALAEFEAALRLGTTHKARARAWIKEIQHRIITYRSSQSSPSPQDAPNTSPEATPDALPRELPAPMPPKQKTDAPKWQL